MGNRTRLPRLLHPALALVLFWALIYALYLIAPIQQTPPVSILGLAYVGSMVVVYAISAMLASSGPFPEQSFTRLDPASEGMSPGAIRLVQLFLSIGIAGSGLNIVARLQAIADFSFADAAALRAERAQMLLEAADPASGMLTGIAFLCYPAGLAAVTAAMLRFESLPATTRILAGAYAALIFLQGIAAGGRSSLLVLILLVAISLYVRRCRGLPTIPRSKLLILIMACAVLGFFGYSTAVWQVRADLADFEVEDFLAHADQVWGVVPTPTLERFVDSVGNQSLLVSLTSSLFYVTQSLAVLERILAAHDLPVLLGAYHVDVVAALFRAFPATATFLGQGYDKLLQDNIYGFFAGAWGALYVDFGLAGSIALVAIWGSLSGFAYRRARMQLYSDRATAYIFSLYAILTSFVSPPLGFSNSAMTFAWFALFYLGVRRVESPNRQFAARPA